MFISSPPEQAEDNIPELLWLHCAANLTGGESSWVSPTKKTERHKSGLSGKSRI